MHYTTQPADVSIKIVFDIDASSGKFLLGFLINKSWCIREKNCHISHFILKFSVGVPLDDGIPRDCIVPEVVLECDRQILF